MITKEYIAGFLDGEGNIGMYKHKDNRLKKGYFLDARLEFVNTNKDVLNLIQKEYDGKLWIKKGQKRCWQLTINKKKSMLKLLKDILPFLIIKKEHSKLMIEFCENRIKNKNDSYSNRDYEIGNIFKKINKRGEC